MSYFKIVENLYYPVKENLEEFTSMRLLLVTISSGSGSTVTSDNCDSVIGNSSSRLFWIVDLHKIFLHLTSFRVLQMGCGDIEVLLKHQCNALEQFVG